MRHHCDSNSPTVTSEPEPKAPAATPTLMLGEDVEDCIAACVACQAICLQTVYYCLKIGGSRASADHIRTLLDCAEMCRTTERFMFGESAFQSRLCALCSEVCRRCEAVCRAMGDAQDLRCAEACDCCAVMLHRAHHVHDPRLSEGW